MKNIFRGNKTIYPTVGLQLRYIKVELLNIENKSDRVIRPKPDDRIRSTDPARNKLDYVNIRFGYISKIFENK